MRALGGLVLASCGSLISATAPTGLVCDRIAVASEHLEDALSGAAPRDCVVVTAGVYTGTFVLPVDVSLAAAQGASVMLKGDGSGGPVLTVRGGKRSTVRNVRVDSSAGNGIVIDPGPASLIGVWVSGDATHQALTSTCASGPCDEVLVQDCEISGGTTGLLASGSIVTVERSHIFGNAGQGVADGTGVVAARGARVTLHQTLVENNQLAGVLVDGATTRVTLDGAFVRGNGERGVWIQNVDGGVDITGGEVSDNKLVGIGVRDSAGVTISRVLVRDTQLVEVPLGISSREQVGDGVGLFSGTRDVLLDAIAAHGNGRAQILADHSGENVRVAAPDLAGGQFRIVVQHAMTAVDVSATLVDDPGRELGTRADALPVAQ